MCNEAARRTALGIMREDFSQLKIPLLFPEGLPNFPATESFRITDSTFIIRAAQGDAGVAEGVMRRWSWPGPAGKPVYNYRSDGRDFRNSGTQGRCLIAADAFYEFTAPADPRQKRKDKWAFAKAGEAWFGIAGLWKADATVGEAFAMLTTEPGPDVAPYHSRQIVIVERRDWAGWLSGAIPAAQVCVPLAAGALTVSAVAR